MSESKIIFTEDILDRVAKEKGYDRDLIEELYFHCAETLEKETNRGEFLAFQLPFFGTLYLTVRGAHLYRRLLRMDIIAQYKRYRKLDDPEGRDKLEKKMAKKWERVEFYDRCILKAVEYITWLKENGQKRVAYLDTVRNVNRIINR